MTTAVQVQYRRGTASQVAAFTGAQGEMVVDTTNNRVVVQDGSTAGGWPAPMASRTPVSDAAHSVAVTDRMIAYTAITAARAVTLCAAANFAQGERLLIVDESGNCSAIKTITINRAGSDTINGATSAVIASAYGYLALESNGSNAWALVDQSITLGNMPSIANNTLLGNSSGSAAAPSAQSAANVNGVLGTNLITCRITGVNFNSANTDNAIAITLPTGFSNYLINGVYISNASASLTTATAGLFTASGGGGTAIAAGGSAITVSSSSANTANNSMSMSLAAGVSTTQSFNAGTLYFRIGTAQGSAATATVTVVIRPIS
jgi:hypothetical protein